MGPTDSRQIWRSVLQRLQAEWTALAPVERDWIASRTARIGALQQQLHQLFEAGDGSALCQRCGGDCCARGKNHLTLTNALAILATDGALPTPDPELTCPWLGPSGCRLAVRVRPFNCVTFVCEAIEARLNAADLQRFYALEQELRRCYREFDQRYAGSSPCGLLIRAERLAGDPLLKRIGPTATAA